VAAARTYQTEPSGDRFQQLVQAQIRELKARRMEQFKAEQEQAAMQKVRRLQKRRSMTAGNLSNLRLISSGHFSW
jgi:hypothetical protein